MPTDVSINLMNLQLSHWPLDPSAVETDVRALAEAIELELARELDGVDLYIERVDIDVRVASELDVRSAIGRALGKRLAEAARLGRERLAGDGASGESRDVDGAVQVVGACAVASRLLPAGSAPRRVEATTAPEASSGPLAHQEASPEDLVPSLATLGRVARSRRWRRLLAALEVEDLEEWLRAILDELEPATDVMPAGAWSGALPDCLTSLRQSIAEDMQALVGYAEPQAREAPAWRARMSALLLVGEVARLGAQRLARPGRVRAQLADDVRRALVVSASAGAAAATSAPPLAQQGVPNVPGESAAPTASAMPAPTDSSESEPASVPAERDEVDEVQVRTLDDAAPLYSACAGLAFLVPLLEELGLGAGLAAVQPEPSLFVQRVLRAILDSLRLSAPDDDAATWLLAGLACAPDQADLEDDARLFGLEQLMALGRASGWPGSAESVEAAAAAWASAVLDEARARFRAAPSSGGERGGSLDLARDVVALGGELISSEERVVAALPYPRRYEALLRAGMLAERSVSWLGERILGFSFHGGITHE